MDLNTNTTDYADYEDFENPSGLGFRIFEATFYLVLSLMISFSSVIVIIVVKRTRSLHSAPGLLMVYLACCDLVNSLTLASGVYPSLTRVDDPYPQTVRMVLAVTLAVTQNVNAMTLVASSLDRLLAITRPFQYPQLVTIPRIIAMLITSIILGCIIPLSWLLSSNGYPVYDPIVYISFLCSKDYNDPLIALGIMFMSPGLIILFCYGVIFVIVVKKRAEMQTQIPITSRRGSLAHGKTLLANINACKMLFVVTFLYFLSFLPYMGVDFYMRYSNELVSVWTYKVTTWIMFCQSLLNGAIFYRMNTTFKSGVIRLMRRWLNLRTDPYVDENISFSMALKSRFSISAEKTYRSSFALSPSPRPSISTGGILKKPHFGIEPNGVN